MSSRVLVEREGRGVLPGISYHGREGVYISTVHHVEVIWEGVIYIDNDDIHTRENNVIGEGVYRPPLVLKLSPLVLKLSGGVYIDDDRPDKT